MLCTVPSPIGPLVLGAHGGSLTAVHLPGSPGAPPEPAGVSAADATVLACAAAQLTAYFAGSLRVFDLPLAPAGTAFQQAVWRALAAIPCGHTTSYGELARALGRPSASRAVGAANGANPLAIVVPCHRVVGASGALTGYAGGVDAKRWLLAHEARMTDGAAALPLRAAATSARRSHARAR